jgi:hypothetical protein
VIPQNTISDNGGNGIAVLGQAHNIAINCSFIGLDVVGAVAFGNGANGVYLANGTHDNTIGSSATTVLRTVISGNVANGVEMDGSSRNTVYGARIGTDLSGLLDFGNGGNGVLIKSGGSNNFIGSKNKDNPGNKIGFNGANGAYVQSGDSNAIRRNLRQRPTGHRFGSRRQPQSGGSSANFRLRNFRLDSDHRQADQPCEFQFPHRILRQPFGRLGRTRSLRLANRANKFERRGKLCRAGLGPAGWFHPRYRHGDQQEQRYVRILKLGTHRAARRT